jgi:hypothetical protein
MKGVKGDRGGWDFPISLFPPRYELMLPRQIPYASFLVVQRDKLKNPI